MSNSSLKRYVLAAIIATFATIPTAFAQDLTTEGLLTFSGGSMAAGVGYTWGHGVLTYQNRDYPFSVEGLSVVDVGVAKISGAGEVYNLKSLEAFSGNYVAAGAGATLAGGGSVAALENQNGVIIHFHSTTEGLKLNLSPAGVAIRLKH